MLPKQSVTAEMWGVLIGMEIVWNKGIRKVIVESDSAALISSINNSNCGQCHNRLIFRILDWKKKDWQVIFSHTYREGNRCADWLANWSFHHQELGTVMINHPPIELATIFSSDLAGASLSLFVNF